jgi:hypothetical protein
MFSGRGDCWMAFRGGWPGSAIEPVGDVGGTKESNKRLGRKMFRGGKEVTSVEMERRW